MRLDLTEAEQDIYDELELIASDVIMLLLAKRRDYGTKNIAITGRYGLAVRMQDKVSRLLNLERPGALPPTVESETSKDTYRDLMGYAMIGLHGDGWDL